ncbi:MAG: Flp pilus assembly protein CpaB [Bacillota bacterium]
MAGSSFVKGTKSTGLLFFLAALVCALLAGWGVLRMVYAANKAVPVVYSSVPIRAYTQLKQEDVKIEYRPRAGVDKGAFPSPGPYLGRYLKTDVPAGVALNDSMFAEEGGGGALAAQVTGLNDGKLRAKGIPLDPITGLGGRIARGDRVDIDGAIRLPIGNQQLPVNKIIARNVQVLDVIMDGEKIAGAIVAVTPQQFQEIDFVVNNAGKVSLALNGYHTDEGASETVATTPDIFIQKFVGEKKADN